MKRRPRPHFNTRRSRLGVCWTRQQTVKRTAMQSHVRAFQWRARPSDPFDALSKAIDEVMALTAGKDRFIVVNRRWLSLAQAKGLFPPKD